MTGPKTNERPGTRAQVKYVRMSATKARAVLDIVRGLPVDDARAVLAYTERSAAEVIGKCMESAIANAEHNDQIDPETLFISACYADEGRTLYRHRPRARGRATKIRKRTCHITIIVSPMPADMLAHWQSKSENIPGSRAARRRGQDAAERAARVAASQGDHDHDHDHDEHDHDHDEEVVTDEVDTAEVEAGDDTETAAAESETATAATDDSATAEATEQDDDATGADEEQK